MDGERIEFTQPDGTVLQLRVFGDEFYAETRTLDGYTVFFDPATKTYFYAMRSPDGNEFISSGILAGIGNPPAGVPKRLSINQQSKRGKIRRNIEADDSETMRSERWKVIKENKRKNRAARGRTQTTAIHGAPASAGAKQGSASSALLSPPSNETTGVRVGLTILVEFPSVPGAIPQQDVDNYCNKPGYTGFGNNGSVFDYFYAQSGGKLRYYNQVTSYVMAPQPKTYYNDTTKSSGYCGRLLLNDILQILIADGYEFSYCTTNSNGRIHAINVFFAGSNSGVWSKGLWPHKSGLSPDVELGAGVYADQYQITNLGTSLKLGTFCHENGHLLCGFPDLYDYDTGVDDSNGSGRYSIMCVSGSYHPVGVGAYLRYHAGWAEMMNMDAASHFRVSVRVDDGPLYQYFNPAASNEYFLVENRSNDYGWEDGSSMPDDGLMIMHCDDDGNSRYDEMTSDTHYEASVEQADGLFHLEYDVNNGGSGDLFHDGDKDTFNDATLPNAHWWANATTSPASGDPSGLDIHDISSSGETMTFIVGAGSLTGAAEVGVDRSLLEPRTFQGESPPDDDIGIWNKNGGTLSYTVSSTNPWISLSSTAGTAQAESDLVTITYNSTALSNGMHHGQVTIENTGDPSDTHSVHIELTIEAAPILSVSLVAIIITGIVEHVSGSTSLVVDNAGEGSLSYSFSGPDWLSVTSTNGTVTGEVDSHEIAFDATGLATGDYLGSLMVNSPDAVNSSVVVWLVFSVTDLLLTAPVSGSYTNKESLAIEWVSSVAAYENIDIELWRDGAQKVVIADNTPNDGSFEWAVPAYLPSASNYTIRVSGEGGAMFRESGPLDICIYRHSFEEGWGGWANRTDDDFDWTRRDQATLSSGTGPDSASEGSYYIYTEATGSSPSDIAMISNIFDLSDFPQIELMFDYHMYGNAMGSLHLDLFDGFAWQMDAWSVTGQQHTADTDSWFTAVVALSPDTTNGTTGIQFRGIIGTSFRSDMAVDNIRLGNYSEPMLTNGVPASWMLSFGLTADNATALLDSDGDGMLNWAEYFAGTSPVDADSVLKVTDVFRGNDDFVVSWMAVYGKPYRILKAPILEPGSWSNAVSGIPGIEPLCTYTIATDTATGFIRIELDE
jgi:M6 family metalloprotease-like protein